MNQRKIKFRAKAIYDGQWIYGGGVLTIGDKTFLFHQQPEGRGCIILVDLKSVGEYINLKDKHGKEICEGDIIQWGEKNHNLAVIEWRSNLAAFQMRRTKPRKLY